MPQIKKLAYDLCRAAPLVDADYSLLLDGIRVRHRVRGLLLALTVHWGCCR